MLDLIEKYVDSPLTEPSPLDQGDQIYEPTAIRGLSDAVGTAVFLSYLQPAAPERDLLGRSRHHLEFAGSLVESEALPFNLFSGFTAVAWALDHLGKVPWGASLSGAETQQSDLTEVDAYLLALTADAPWRRGYDLVSGLVGLGVYAAQRLPDPVGEEILTNVVGRLEELAEVDDGTARWFTPPEAIPESQKEYYPDGYYNLGLAHGTPGVIAVLSHAVAAGVAASRARPLLEKAVSWLLAQQQPEARPCVFPGAIVPSAEPMPSRMAWCYGDPGVSITLLLAARNAGVEEWESEARAIALRCSRQELEGSRVVDGLLCHGSFGLMHIFNRLWQATGEMPFARAARYWFEDGYRRFSTHPALEGLKNRSYPQWVMGRGLVSGAGGVGLALLAAVTETEPAWDRVMLMGVAPSTAKGRGRR